MSDILTLEQSLHHFAGMSREEFELSLPYWEVREYKKGAFYNEHGTVCKHLGFVFDGVFRIYYLDEPSGEERNVLFFSKNQFISAFKSFMQQRPCDYFTQAMSDARVLNIHYDHLQQLYRESQAWERLGRLIAETAFNGSMNRIESFLFQSPEQRYLQLMQDHPDILNTVPLYHISSYLGIQGPSLSRIRRRLSGS